MQLEITKIEEKKNCQIYHTNSKEEYKNKPPLYSYFDSCVENNGTFHTQQMTIFSQEDLELYIKALEKTYAYVLEEKGIYNVTLEDEYVFGIDDRKNIIYGKVIDFEKYNNKVVMQLIKFNNISTNANNIVSIGPQYLINIKDKKSLLKFKEDRIIDINLKLLFNNIEDDISDLQDNIIEVCKKYKSLSKELNNFNSTKNGVKRKKRKFKYIEKQLFVLKDKLKDLNIQKQKIIEDKEFNEFIDFVINL